jgi:tetratricopeptide (TPR) repeat protein
MANPKDWNKEIEKYRKETETDPKDADAWYNMGVALIQSVGAKIQGGALDAECKEKVPKAESALKRAIELFPQHGRAHVLLAQLYRYIKRYDESIEYAKVGLGLPPGSQDWFAAAETVASCYMLKNDMPHSIEYLEIIKEQFPDDAMTIFKRACCYWEVGKLDEAEEEFAHLVKVNPSHPNAQSCLDQVRQKKASVAGGAVSKKEDKKADVTPKKDDKKADATQKKVQDAQAKGQALGKKLSEDIQKVMASNMAPEKKSAEVTRLQKEFNDDLQKLMKG